MHFARIHRTLRKPDAVCEKLGNFATPRLPLRKITDLWDESIPIAKNQRAFRKPDSLCERPWNFAKTRFHLRKARELCGNLIPYPTRTFPNLLRCRPIMDGPYLVAISGPAVG